MVRRTWPEDWSQRMAGVGCEMCANGVPERDDYGLLIYRGRLSAAYLQWGGPQRSYTIVRWAGRHVAEPTELSEDEAVSYWLDVLKVGRALMTHFDGCKVNYQMLGNALPHLHTHVVVRFLDDPSPSRPLSMTRKPLPRDKVEADAEALRVALA